MFAGGGLGSTLWRDCRGVDTQAIQAVQKKIRSGKGWKTVENSGKQWKMVKLFLKSVKFFLIFGVCPIPGAPAFPVQGGCGDHL